MGKQMGVQAIGVLATGAYTAVVSGLLLKLVGAMMGLRVTAEAESTGLDTAEHNERGYDL